MKTLKDIEKVMSAFEQKTGINIQTASQGSEAWFKSKLGVLSASNASKIVAKVDSETRKTYMLELISQIATGLSEEINSKYLDWGKSNEDAARSSYEFRHDVEVYEIPFIFKDESFRCGVSVDGLAKFATALTPVEYKCPYNTIHYLKFFLEDKIKSEYEWQCQFGMWVLDAEIYHMSQFDPRVKSASFKTIEVERDEKKQATLNDAVPQFISDMDKYLAQLGLSFGSQWSSLPAKESSVVA